MDKRALRKRCWGALLASGADRFPGVEGRIPNFVGAEAAAELLASTEPWKRARTIECNPDLPQRPARYRALKQGKRVYVAVPRLSTEKPFLLLDPEALDPKSLWLASSIQGAFRLGRAVALGEMEPIELVLTGCVGAGRDGARLGKGAGWSDLEYALLREAGLASARTPVASTVHPTQIVREGELPMSAHDVPLDLFATPEEVIECPRRFKRPTGVRWAELDDERRRDVPVLSQGRLVTSSKPSSNRTRARHRKARAKR